MHLPRSRWLTAYTFNICHLADRCSDFWLLLHPDRVCRTGSIGPGSVALCLGLHACACHPGCGFDVAVAHLGGRDLFRLGRLDTAAAASCLAKNAAVTACRSPKPIKARIDTRPRADASADICSQVRAIAILVLGGRSGHNQTSIFALHRIRRRQQIAVLHHAHVG